MPETVMASAEYSQLLAQHSAMSEQHAALTEELNKTKAGTRECFIAVHHKSRHHDSSSCVILLLIVCVTIVRLQNVQERSQSFDGEIRRGAESPGRA